MQSIRFIHMLSHFGNCIFRMLTDDEYDGGLGDNAFGCVEERRREEAIMTQDITRWRLRRARISHMASFYDAANAFWAVKAKNISDQVWLRVKDPTAEQFIKQLTDKHFVCDFEKDIQNYYKIDMHPNNKGYESLFNCVKKILQSQL